MCVSVSVRIIRSRSYLAIYLTLYTCIHIRYACVYAYMYVCVCVCIYVCMHVYMYVCMYICMYVCMMCMSVRIIRSRGYLASYLTSDVVVKPVPLVLFNG